MMRILTCIGLGVLLSGMAFAQSPEDRFKLTVHNEEQSVNVYALTMPKGETKLKKADPSSRSLCRRPTSAEISNNPALNLGWVCQNTTMAQLVAQLRDWAPAYFDHPVIDATGLEGGWDFSLAWTPKGLLLPAGGSGSADPNGGLTVFEAVDKQLGLKLAQQKHSMPVSRHRSRRAEADQ